MDALRTMFRHHAWATLALIDHCATLPPERLADEVPGTFGPILATLRHMVSADERYQWRVSGRDPKVLRERDAGEATISLAELRARFEAQAKGWEQLLDRAGDLDLTLPPGTWPELSHGEVPHAEDLLLLQAIHHGNDHRTHVCTTLGALGLEAPDLDGWTYWPASGRVPVRT
jgi:uncharacterized damage-inducible protein DinB